MDEDIFCEPLTPLPPYFGYQQNSPHSSENFYYQPPVPIKTPGEWQQELGLSTEEDGIPPITSVDPGSSTW
jgi:hypothetical protein